MDITSAIDTLLLFNEKADKLEKSSFIKNYLDTSIVTSWKRGQSVIEAKRYGPDDEAIEAFVLTIRFFIRNNDNMSLSIITNLYADLPIDIELIESVKEAHTKINTFLDTISNFKVVRNETKSSQKYIDTYTYREILDIIIWGGLAHADIEKKKVYGHWKNIPVFIARAEVVFIHALKTLLDAILLIRNINNEALKQLKALT